MACVWLPPATGSKVGGSLGWESESDPLIPTLTTKLVVHAGWAAEQSWTSSTPDVFDGSPTCSSLIGPDRASDAENVRWTTPVVPVHGLLFLLVHVPRPVTLLSV